MVGFYGSYSHNLDAKGRIIVPARFRTLLGPEFYLSFGYEKCLCIYSTEQYDKRMEKMAEHPENNENSRAIMRTTASHTVPCSFDNQGRVQIPNNLLEYGMIKKDCVINGAYDHIEIWDAERWKEYSSAILENFDSIAGNIQ